MNKYEITIERKQSNQVIGIKKETIELPKNYRSLVGTRRRITPDIIEVVTSQKPIDFNEPQVKVVKTPNKPKKLEIKLELTDNPQLLKEQLKEAIKAITDARKALKNRKQYNEVDEILDNALDDIFKLEKTSVNK